MIQLKVPATHAEIEEFIGKSYRQPLLGLYGSDERDWMMDRDAFINAALGKASEYHPQPKWFLAVPLPQIDGYIARHVLQSETSILEEYHARDDLREDIAKPIGEKHRLFVGYIGEEIAWHGQDPMMVARMAFKEGWAWLDGGLENDRSGDIVAVIGVSKELSINRIVE